MISVKSFRKAVVPSGNLQGQTVYMTIYDDGSVSVFFDDNPDVPCSTCKAVLVPWGRLAG